MVALAGSIGIIGIALIFSVSNGMTSYINVIQEETLSFCGVTTGFPSRSSSGVKPAAFPFL